MGVFMTDRIETERLLRESEARCDAAAERRVVYVIDLNGKSANIEIRPNPIDKHIGVRVGMKRIAVGLTAQELADAVGITADQLQKYETGSTRIDACLLLKITKAMSVSPAFFFEGLSFG
jgi:DNA-binding Xre family transcriptional regulator